MTPSEIARIIAEAAAGGRALPAECYNDSSVFDAERERVLRPGWHAVARWDELPEPGDRRAIDLHGEPVLLVRGQDDVLRAMSGVCLHRAFPLVSGEGHGKDIVCPYHRWAYDLEGRLKGAPFMDEVPAFDRDTCRLPQLPLEIWEGFVMVSTNSAAEPLAPRLSALSELLAPLDLGKLVHVAAADWDSPWNWKVMVENFMESYHHMGPHAAGLGKSHPPRGTHRLPIDGPCTVLENPAVEGEDPFWVIQVFPTLLLAPSRGEPTVVPWYEMQIDRHDHLHLRIHLLMPEAFAKDAATVELVSDFLRQVHLEDIPVCEGVQRGIQSRIWRPGLLSRQEETLSAFHRYLTERLSTAPS